MTGMFLAIFTFLSAVYKTKKPHMIVIVLTLLIGVGYTVYANISERVVTLEFSDRSTCQKLDTMNGSLIRIEKGVENTQKDISELKNTLIRRRR